MTADSPEPTARPFFTLKNGICFGIILAILGGLSAFVDDVRLSSFQMIQPGLPAVSITLPFLAPSKKPPSPFRIDGKINASLFFSGWLNFTPDDCVSSIAINGQAVDLNGISSTERCDWRTGFKLDVRPYLKLGENSVSIELDDRYGGNFGLSITSPVPSFSKFLLVLILSLLSVVFMHLMVPTYARVQAPVAAAYSHFTHTRPRLFRYLLFALVIVISYFTYFKGYDQPAGPFWDENYHIVSAQKYLNRVFFMEMHPPLGKMMIALGEKIFQPNIRTDQFINSDYAKAFPQSMSFAGYRFFPALFGWWTAPLLFIFFLLLIESPLWAFLFSFLYIFDNALIVHNRGAMIEGLLLFLTVLLSTLFLLLLRWHEARPKWFLKTAFCFGLVFGLLMTTKSLGLIMILLFPAVLWKTRTSKGQSLQFLGLACVGFLISYVGVWQTHFTIANKVNPILQNSGYYQASETYRRILDADMSGSLFGFPTMIKDSLYFGNVSYQNGVPKLDLCKPDENGSSPTVWPLGARTISYRWDAVGSEVYHLYLVSNPVTWLCGLLGIFLALIFWGARVFIPGTLPLERSFPALVFTVLYLSYMIAIYKTASTRVMYLYHYFIPLFFSFTLFALMWSEVKQVAGFALNHSRKTIALLLVSGAIVGSFLFYSPLTYHLGLSRSEFMKRAILNVWDMKPKGYSN